MCNKFFGLVLVLVLAAGCTSTRSTLYDWGDYEENLFTYYERPAAKEKILAAHLKFVARQEQLNHRMAPGLFAEAGTLLLLEGRRDEAIVYYQKEHDLWPESRQMMSALIRNLQQEKKDE